MITKPAGGSGFCCSSKKAFFEEMELTQGK